VLWLPKTRAAMPGVPCVAVQTGAPPVTPLAAMCDAQLVVVPPATMQSQKPFGLKLVHVALTGTRLQVWSPQAGVSNVPSCPVSGTTRSQTQFPVS
jgi:hypothetical protein